MKIVTIGTGYVGLVTGTCLAELGNNVTCVDVDAKKINQLKRGKSPIYEPGLEELIKRNKEEGRLTFTTSLKTVVKNAEVIFIAVGTPPKPNGEADLQYVEAVAEEIGKNLKNYAVIVNKSTVPIGTGNLVTNIIKKHYRGNFDVVSNPEFLREGEAVNDSLKPDRVVIGNSSPKALKIMKNLYKPLRCPIISTNRETSEMIKYASNSLLAVEISFINNIANICEKVGADVTKVAEGMRYDRRIGKRAFLDAGAGYGGSCFPKDVQALIKIAKKYKTNFKILNETEAVNKKQKTSLVSKLKKVLPTLKNTRIAIWGLSFKPKTDDMREAPSIEIINALQKEGAKIIAFDPVAQEESKKILKNIQYAKNPYDTIKGCDALLIVTDWDEFRQLDKQKIKKLLKKPVIVDGRNIYDPKEMCQLEFEYISVGRPHIHTLDNQCKNGSKTILP
jgi:UDPglucose 6-dehydrogenase